MHTRELLSRGEDLQRINSIVTWPEVDFYDGRERAALNWAERCTRLSQAHPEQQRSEEHTSELQSPCNLVCRLLLEKKKNTSRLQRYRVVTSLTLILLQP